MNLLISLVSFVWGLLNTVFRGWVAATFWTWFVVTSFPQAPHLSVAAAIGFSYFIAIMTPYKSFTSKDWDEAKLLDSDERREMGVINNGVQSFMLVLILFGGWVMHHFFM